MRITDITESGQLKDDTFRSLPPEVAEGYYLEEGDILLARSGSIGRSFIYRAEWGEACFAGYLVRARVSAEFDPRFVYWSLNALNFWSWIESIAIRSTIQNVSAERYAEYPVPAPPLGTQRKIARFLDDKTAQIDGLIGKKRELLDRLSEKRQALITSVVTKGLGADVPSKPSDISAQSRCRPGAEGTGGMTEVALPQDWSSKRLKHIATYNDEVLAESTDEEKEIDYVEISGVSLSDGIEEIERTSFGRAPSRARRKVRSGDILISTVRTYLRAIARVDEASPDLVASTGFCVVRPNEEVDSGFLGWVAKSEAFVAEVVARSVGVSYPAINASDLVTICVPLAPLGTQRRIAGFLDERTAEIDGLIERIRDSVARLEEYRSAQITAAVIGELTELL